MSSWVSNVTQLPNDSTLTLRPVLPSRRYSIFGLTVGVAMRPTIPPTIRPSDPAESARAATARQTFGTRPASRSAGDLGVHQVEHLATQATDRAGVGRWSSAANSAARADGHVEHRRRPATTSSRYPTSTAPAAT